MNIRTTVRYIGSYDTIMKRIKASDKEMLKYKHIHIEYILYKNKSTEDINLEYVSIIEYLKQFGVNNDNINFVVRKYYD